MTTWKLRNIVKEDEVNAAADEGCDDGVHPRHHIVVHMSEEGKRTVLSVLARLQHTAKHSPLYITVSKKFRCLGKLVRDCN